mmetsp:Transcript_13208/g.19769  ORF Transcript_13208/g.19769 Transcript_13208/m.19769 type:complete len:551 (-) Transcript_13208:139-1791(-)
MRLQTSTLILAAAISSSATAFAPSALAPRQATRLDAGTPMPQVLPLVDLPSPADIPEVISWPFTFQRVQLFLGGSIPGSTNVMLGQPKSNKGTTIVGQTVLLASQKIATQIPNASEYKFFGNGNHSKNLQYLLKTNPFMATALTENGSGFELRSFDTRDPHAEDPSASLYRQIISCLGGADHRVNIRFDADMSIREIRVYEENTGLLITKLNKLLGWKSEEVDKWASSALFNLGYYASCVHANMHVLHYLMTAALDESSKEFDAMNEWASFYATNVPNKYGQVSDLLIRKQPKLTDLLVQGNDGTVKDTYALLTGSSGFGANGDKLRLILTKLLNVWTNDPTNYIANMLQVPKDKLVKAGILTEFMKHHDLVPDYAREIAEALKNTDEDKFGIAEDRLKIYLKRCSGFTSRIDSLEDWIELMAVTGIVHGCTLSYSRLFADADILRWRDIQTETWQAPDVNLHLKILGTICGMDEHRHVMSSSTDVVGQKYDAKLQDVLDTYEEKATDYKESYKNEIMKNTHEFNNYGWILSDFCPDGFDGKQLTVSTYI